MHNINYQEINWDNKRFAFSLEAKIKHTERDFGRKIGSYRLTKTIESDGRKHEFEEKFAKALRHTNPKGETYLFGKFYNGRRDSLMVTLAYLQDGVWFPCQN